MKIYEFVTKLLASTHSTHTNEVPTTIQALLSWATTKNQLIMCFSNSSGATFKRHEQGWKSKQEKTFGHRITPSGQFMH